MADPVPAPRVAVVCLHCDGHGKTAHPTSGADGRSYVVPQECRWCAGSGRRRRFEPPV